MAKPKKFRFRAPSTIGVGFALFFIGMLTMFAGKVVQERLSSDDGWTIFFAGIMLLLSGGIVALAGRLGDQP